MPKPKRISTVYPTPRPIIADVVATEAPYFADPTGKSDATDAIRRALNDVGAAGGGTVFLPIGRYSVRGSITVPSHCALIGDWLDPREGSAHGTVILADVPSIDAPLPALFDLGGSAGVMGLTVLYPNQTLTSPKPYPFTFYTNGIGDHFMLSSVQNCTVLGGYRGIGACVAEENPHEQFTVDGFFASCLSVGAEVYNQSDVGTWKNVFLSPRFWAQMGEEAGAPTLDDLRTYMRAHTTGLRLGDLEWTEFAGLTIEDCRIGMHIVKGKRIEFAGSVYDARISGCEIGMQVDRIDDRWGMVLAASSIEGSVCSIRHNARGVVKMTDVTLTGPVEGEGELLFGKGRVPKDFLPVRTSCVQENGGLHVCDRAGEDISESLSELLSSASEGDVVYLPAGIYRLSRPIVIPGGVELRGGALPVRGLGGEKTGVVLITDLRGDEHSPALITLGGDGAAISGIQIVWNKNGPHTLHSTPYAIRGRGREVRCINCSIAGASYGVDFSGCDRHSIKKLSTLCYRNAILAGGEGGVIEGCLQNGTVLTRMTAPDAEGMISESRIFEELFPITRRGLPPMKRDERCGPPIGNVRPNERTEKPEERRGCVYLRLRGAKDETVFNTFAYGVGSLLLAEGSEGLRLCNLGADNIAHPQMIFKESTACGVNLMRYNGSSFEIHGGEISLLNRLTILDKYEENI